jgi:phosphatidate phosphatase PAH1
MKRYTLALVMSALLAGCGGVDPLDPTAEEKAAVTSSLPPCPVVPSCNSPLPTLPRATGFNSWMSTLTARLGFFANHRGRDQLIKPGDPQWVLGKFTYGLADKDIHGEPVDIYLERNCGGTWEKLTTIATTYDDSHPTVNLVDDSGGRVFYQIPEEQALGEGRHRVLMVVRGDNTKTEQIIEVRPAGTPVAVIDVDGTLTGSELDEIGNAVQGKIGEANSGGPEMVRALVSKGYRPFFLTARMEVLAGRTRDFLQLRGFPPGLMHTTVWYAGAISDGAKVDYKTAELALLAEQGMRVLVGVGNTTTDAQAYANAEIPRTFMYQFDDQVHGGVRVDDYNQLAAELTARLPALCR